MHNTRETYVGTFIMDDALEHFRGGTIPRRPPRRPVERLAGQAQEHPAAPVARRKIEENKVSRTSPGGAVVR